MDNRAVGRSENLICNTVAVICSPCLNRKNVTSKNLGTIPRVAPTVPTGLDKIEVTRTTAACDYRAVGPPPLLKILSKLRI